MLRRPVCFRDAALLVVYRPVSPLAVFAAVEDESTPGAGRKLRGTLTSFDCGTLATNLYIGIGIFLIFLRGHHDGQDGEGVSRGLIAEGCSTAGSGARALGCWTQDIHSVKKFCVDVVN
jgi:hypothetical protein